jgi:serine protease AprX
MLGKWILCCSLFITTRAFAQAQPQYAFRVSFSDKAGSPSISNPLAFLTQRSLDRRTAQGIAIDATDQPVSPLYLDTVLTLTLGKLHVTSKWLNNCVILLHDSSKILLLQNKPYITDIRYIAYYSTGLHMAVPGGTGSGTSIAPSSKYKTTGNPAWYGSSWDQTNLVHGDCLHDKGWKGEGKLIAILDDGYVGVNSGVGFDSLYKSGRIVDKRNFVLADTFVYGYSGHGTEVLSAMAAYLPNTYVGSAPLAQYALYITEQLNVELQIEMDNMVAAFERADSIGADVISTSLGYNIFPNVPSYTIPVSDFDGKTTPPARAANMASAKGILMVITAGNEGAGGLLTPGDADSAVTVGAVNISKAPASFSGHGPNAAGVIKPDVCALGQPGYGMGAGSIPFPVNGTSIATPQIAGFAACLWQGSPGRKSSEVKRAIISGADLYPTPNMPQLGYGAANFCKSTAVLDVHDVIGQAFGITIFPNPVNKAITISLYSTAGESLHVTLTDVTGKILMSSHHTLSGGSNRINIPTPAGLAPGIYLCRLVIAQQVRAVKLVKE